MADIKMREVLEGEVPPNGGSAIQDHVDRPVVVGEGPNNYLCGNCGNLLAEALSPPQMNIKVRIRCAKCGSLQVALQPEKEEAGAKK
jgi:DNA-directed RNA polymerase subunit RPC12/RpoP